MISNQPFAAAAPAHAEARADRSASSHMAGAAGRASAPFFRPADRGPAQPA